MIMSHPLTCSILGRQCYATKRGSPGLDMNRYRRVGDSSKILRTALGVFMSGWRPLIKGFFCGVAFDRGCGPTWLAVDKGWLKRPGPGPELPRVHAVVRRVTKDARALTIPVAPPAQRAFLQSREGPPSPPSLEASRNCRFVSGGTWPRRLAGGDRQPVDRVP
jgi:hypothetical protein